MTQTAQDPNRGATRQLASGVPAARACLPAARACLPAARACLPAARACLIVSALLSLAACGAVPKAAGPDSVAGLAPSGRVSLTETFVAGAGAGGGTLHFQGQTYPFDLAGTIVGGFGASQVQASGDVYRLTSVSDFGGVYTQTSDKTGYNAAKTDDLWLRNKAGVIMHLIGSQTGGSLSLGRDEILIKLTQ